MLDDNLTPWLIEINSSPAMDYSTTVTKVLVKQVLADCIKVLVDFKLSRKKSQVDTGNFTCIHKSKFANERPMHSVGLNLMCEGKAYK
jgi:tubulin monoglycylase TTLL3/8